MAAISVVWKWSLCPSSRRRPESTPPKNGAENFAKTGIRCRPKFLIDLIGRCYEDIHYQLILLTVFVAFTHACANITPGLLAATKTAAIDLTECKFPKLKEPARCGKLPVYEDRGAKSGRMIALNIVVLPALSSEPKADPVFYLAGGPGQAAARIASAGEDPIMRDLRRERDLVFVDMRGTGESNGLQCGFAVNRRKAQSFFGEIFDPADIRACRDKLALVADLKLYNTQLGIDDLDDVRIALGYDNINLYGISHGSQAAFEYLRRYPDQTRTATLAGVATAAAKVPLQFARGAEQALTRLFDDCAADATCATAFPKLADKFAKLMENLSSGPVRFDFTRPETKAIDSVQITRGVFVVRLLSLLYSHRTARLLPLVIDSAVNGNWSLFGQITTRASAPSEFRVYLGAYLSTTCSESLPFIDETELARATAGTFMGESGTRRHQQACAHWPRGVIDEGYFKPVQGPTPVLMLSGDIDPATLAEFGAQALKTLPHGRQVILRNTPHSYTSPCARELIVGFIASGSAEELDASCATRLRRPPFATELPASYNR